MIYMHFESPPTPHFISAGEALYRRGDRHKKRSSIGVFDMLFVVSGRLYLMEENQHYIIDENQLLILSPDKIHQGYKLCDSETKFYWLHMGCAGSYYESEHLHPAKKIVNKSLFRDTMFYITLPKYIQLTEEKGKLLRSFIEPLLMFSINKYSNATEKFRTRLNPLQQQQHFLNILNLLNTDSKFSNAPDDLAAEIMQYMQNHYHTSFTMQDLARKFNFHPVHMIRCMKNSYHVTPIQALKGKELLLTTAMSVQDISEAVGFSSCSYFIKQFKAAYHTTPSQFRQEIQSHF